jgi:hypothetical protein
MFSYISQSERRFLQIWWIMILIVIVSFKINDLSSCVANASAENHSTAIHILNFDSSFLVQYSWHFDRLIIIKLSTICVDILQSNHISFVWLSTRLDIKIYEQCIAWSLIALILIVCFLVFASCFLLLAFCFLLLIYCFLFLASWQCLI